MDIIGTYQVRTLIGPTPDGPRRVTREEYIEAAKSSGNSPREIMQSIMIANGRLKISEDGKIYVLSPIPEGVPENRMGMFSVGILYMFALQVILVLLAIGLQYMERYSALKEAEAKQKQKASEAELSWLKNQLNPHFLFNTLNNISSLTQFDSDRAQESIGQLSDLLRYALYETEEAFVPLASEVEFMENYISLMSLRCNDLTTVEQDFEVSSENIRIAPLLFISILENAFKHGVNARSKSFVNVSLRRSGDDIIFRCENSLFEKAGTDRIGSGIGIENLRRRLELIYPLRHEFKCGAVDDRYVAEITLKGICTGA